jgi:hypothetical protein
MACLTMLLGKYALLQVLQLPIVVSKLKKLLQAAVKKIAQLGTPVIPSSDESLELFLQTAGKFFGKDPTRWDQMGKSMHCAGGPSMAHACLHEHTMQHACMAHAPVPVYLRLSHLLRVYMTQLARQCTEGRQQLKARLAAQHTRTACGTGAAGCMPHVATASSHAMLHVQVIPRLRSRRRLASATSSPRVSSQAQSCTCSWRCAGPQSSLARLCRGHQPTGACKQDLDISTSQQDDHIQLHTASASSLHSSHDSAHASRATR